MIGDQSTTLVSPEQGEYNDAFVECIREVDNRLSLYRFAA
jgi:hypothetical protein